MATRERAGRLHALLAAESVSVHAVNPVVSAADFANRGRTCSLGMAQRHEQPVADGQLTGNIADSARTAMVLDGACAALRTAGSG